MEESSQVQSRSRRRMVEVRVTQAPRIPWPVLERKLTDEWLPGEHVTLIGPTGAGKTHMALTLAELCQYVMVLATKRSDPLVTQLKADGYLITGRLEDIVYGEDGPVHKRVVYWPVYPAKTTTQERLKLLAGDFRRALDYADRIGGWAVVMDETMFLYRNLKLERE